MRTSTLHLLAALLLATCVGCVGGAPPELPPAPALQRQPPRPPGIDDVTRGKFPWPLPLEEAENILLKTSLFEVGGQPQKRQVYAYNVVFSQPDALERFRRLAARAAVPGRLYALCALQELAPSEAVRIGRELAASTDVITVGDHDAYDSQRVRDVVVLVLARRLGVEFHDSRREVEEYFKERAG